MPIPFRFSLVFSVACLLLAACAAPAGHGSAVRERGRTLFEARCATCHGLPAVQACTKDVMDAMAPEAELTPQERAAVEAYLAAEKK